MIPHYDYEAKLRSKTRQIVVKIDEFAENCIINCNDTTH